MPSGFVSLCMQGYACVELHLSTHVLVQTVDEWLEVVSNQRTYIAAARGRVPGHMLFAGHVPVALAQVGEWGWGICSVSRGCR